MLATVAIFVSLLYLQNYYKQKKKKKKKNNVNYKSLSIWETTSD